MSFRFNRMPYVRYIINATAVCEIRITHNIYVYIMRTRQKTTTKRIRIDGVVLGLRHLHDDGDIRQSYMVFWGG